LATRHEIVDLIKRRYEYIILGFAIALFMIIRLVNLKAVPVQMDEIHIITWAQKGFKSGAVASLRFGKPPLYPMMLTLFLRVFSDPVTAARALSAASGAASLTGIILTGKEMKDWKLGAWAALFWVICPYMVWYERFGIVESMLVALMVWAVFFAVKAVYSSKYLFLAGTGACLGLAMWTKQNAAVMFLVIPFTFLVKSPGDDIRKSLKQLLKFGIATGLAFLLAYGIYNLLRFSSHYYRLGYRVYLHTRTTLAAGPFDKLTENLSHILRIVLNNVTPLLFALAVVGIVTGLLRKWRPSVFLAMWFLVIWIAASYVSRTGTGSRYWVILVPPVSLAAGYAVRELPGLVAGAIRKIRKTGTRRAVALVALVLSTVFMVAMLIPVASNDIYMVSSPERSYMRTNLKRVLWGWGYFEAVDELKEKSRDGKVIVFVRDSFTKMVMDAYFREDRLIDVRYSIVPEIRLSAARAETDQVYVVFRTKEVEEAFLKQEKTYPEENDYIRRSRLTSDEGMYSGLINLARVEVPYIGSIVPGTAPVGTPVSVKGGNFGEGPGEVRFGKTPATVREWKDDEIVVTVPKSSYWSKVRVYATLGSSQYEPFRLK
jgi:4-amino-4-deoxy-L-arabinose transferase-like glycosyltransferase